MDLTLIGPDRREATRLGHVHFARLWLTIADVVGMAVGAGVAVALILALIV